MTCGTGQGHYGDGLYFSKNSMTAKGYGLAPPCVRPPANMQHFVSADAGNAVFVALILRGATEEEREVVTDECRGSRLPPQYKSRHVMKESGIEEYVIFDEARAIPRYLIIF